jgi:hypothetical protein
LLADVIEYAARTAVLIIGSIYLNFLRSVICSGGYSRFRKKARDYGDGKLKSTE